MGPKLHYQQHEWRIEQFIPSRPMVIWEMRNPVIYTEMAKRLCHFNLSTGKAVSDFHPLTPENIQIRQVID